MRTRNLPLIPLALAGLALLACDGKKELVCASDRSACDGECVALQADPAHCGSCGNACDPGQTCFQGSCQPSTVTDCGAPGRACAIGESCREGRCIAPLYLACFNTGEVREALDTVVGEEHTLSAIGVPLTVAPGTVSLASLGAELYAAAGTYGGVETLARIAREPPDVRVASLWTSDVSLPDLEYLTTHGGYLYVSQSSLGKLLVFSPTGRLVAEHAFGVANQPNPNPLGIAFSGERAYVALQGRDEVAVLDVSAVGRCATPTTCITEVTRVDVSGLADAGASAMPARVTIVGGRAYVVLWNLDASFQALANTNGKLAVIDLATNALDATAGGGGQVDLGAGCLDPADAALSGNTLFVTCGIFDYSHYPAVTTHGQGIVPLDLRPTVPAVGAILPAPENSAPGKLAFCGSTGYVADRATGTVFVLHPAHGAVQGATLCPDAEGGSAYVADIACGE
jgi:DNA-binding beta-propeller fold protein YncE